jgi:hypothetical protein
MQRFMHFERFRFPLPAHFFEQRPIFLLIWISEAPRVPGS